MGIRNQCQSATASKPKTVIVGSQNAHKSTFSTAPWKNPREGFCSAKLNTCGARAIKGTDLCVAHTAKAKKPVVEVDDAAE